MSLRNIREILLDIILPAQCVVCGRDLANGEQDICLHCMAAFPRVTLRSITENEIHRRLMTKDTEIEHAGALMLYNRESTYARLIHTAKYSGRPALCRRLGNMLANSLITSGFFDSIDLIVPVPMPMFKKLRRGYNQSAEIAHGISDISHIPVADDCLRSRRHSTQTHKNSAGRLENTRHAYFMTHTADWKGVRHILLVDDVITTGATMLACAHHLHQGIPDVKVSVAAVALTTLN